MTKCLGTQDDHCCWLSGKVCVFLEQYTVPDRRWVCGLFRELGSWEAVYKDPRYVSQVKPFWDGFAPGKGCGDWPLAGTTCEVCGAKNG